MLACTFFFFFFYLRIWKLNTHAIIIKCSRCSLLKNIKCIIKFSKLSIICVLILPRLYKKNFVINTVQNFRAAEKCWISRAPADTDKSFFAYTAELK